MVYRHESDEDAFDGPPRPGPDLSVPASRRPARTGPAPSRFPTPSLPRPARAQPPSAAPPPEPPATPTPRRALPGSTPPRVRTRAADAPPQSPRSRRVRDTRRFGSRPWQVTFGGVAVLSLLALSGLGAAVLLPDRTSEPDVAPSRPAAAPPPATGRKVIDSRDTDPAPLTAKEVFPGSKLTPDDDDKSYAVLKTQASDSCAVAATGEVADLLVLLGCSQVVRATVRSPDEKFLLTAGVFNMTDLATAQRVRDRLRKMLDGRQGQLRGMPAGDGTKALTAAAPRADWKVRGHYLAYGVVVRTDGTPVKAGDPAAREVLSDLIEEHLTDGVLERRATRGADD